MKEGVAATHVRATLPTRPAGMVAFQDGARARKEEVVEEKSNREIAAFHNTLVAPQRP